jgi:hypothetical protein
MLSQSVLNSVKFSKNKKRDVKKKKVVTSFKHKNSILVQNIFNFKTRK